MKARRRRPRLGLSILEKWVLRSLERLEKMSFLAEGRGGGGGGAEAVQRAAEGAPLPSRWYKPPSPAPGARPEGILKADEPWPGRFLPTEVAERRKLEI